MSDAYNFNLDSFQLLDSMYLFSLSDKINLSFKNNGLCNQLLSTISLNEIFLSFGCCIHGILVQYNLFLFCAETSDEFISIGCTHNSFDIIS